jgi:hypothetical protein
MKQKALIELRKLETENPWKGSGMRNSERVDFVEEPLIGQMSSGTCSADFPGIAKHHIKGKYVYVHSEEFKSSNHAARKDTEDRIYCMYSS